MQTANWNKKTILTDIIILLILILGFYSIQLGTRSLLNPDEARYSSVAIEMTQSGDYLTPKLAGTVFLDKPILYYWLQSSAIKMFGVHEWSLRFWPMLIGVLGCLFLYISTRLLFSRQVGLTSAIILSTTILYYGGAHYADMDLEVANFISVSLLSFLLGYHFRDHKKSKWWYWCAYLFAALAFLTKGLIAIAFPVMIVGLWILMLRQWRAILQLRLISGALIFIVMVVPWFYLVQRQNSDFLYYFFIYQQFYRYVSSEFNNMQPFWFYLAVILIGSGGWGLLYFPSLSLLWQRYKNKSADFPYLLFLFIWVVVVLLFFSIPKSKLLGYILPVMPPLAIIIGYYCVQKGLAQRPAAIILKLTASYSFLFLLLLFIASFYLIHRAEWSGSQVYPWCLSVVMILLLGALILGWVKQYNNNYFYRYSAVSMALFLLLLNNMSGHLFLMNSTRDLARSMPESLSTNTKLVSYNNFYPDFGIYVHQPVYIAAPWSTLINDCPREGDMGHLACACKQDLKRCSLLINPEKLKIWWQQQQPVYVLVDLNKLSEFRQQVGDYYLLRKTLNLALVTNIRQISR